MADNGKTTTTVEADNHETTTTADPRTSATSVGEPTIALAELTADLEEWLREAREAAAIDAEDIITQAEEADAVDPIG